MNKINKYLWIFVLGIILISNVCLALRNPAAVYCKEMGYDYEIKETEKGQEGLCVVSSGIKFKSWDFLKGKIGKEYSYCAKQGYDIKTISEKDSGYAVCVPKKTKEFESLEISSGFAKSDEIPMTEMMNLEDKLNDYKPRKISKESKPSLKTSFQELPLDLQKLKSNSQYNYTNFSSWDWRDPPASTSYNKNNFTFFDDNNGWLTTIKNQGACGSCWAFASAASVEAKYELIQNNSRLNSNLAEQYSVSCDHSCYPGATWPGGGCQGGCDGGWMDLNLRFMKLNGTVDDACFPYIGLDGDCSNKCSDYDYRLWYITDYTSTWSWNYTSEEEYHYYLTNNETEQWIIDNGPLVAGIGIGSNYGGYWDGSIYRCTDDTGINHAVVVLGYNDTGNDATSYWIIKNSWGTGWGESGYFKLGFNECDFTTEFDFPHSVTPPDFKPSIDVSSPSSGYISNSNQIEFNFTVINRVAATSACDLIINGSINQTNSSVNNNTLTTLISNLPDGNYSWNISCWEDNLGIVNTSVTRIFSVDTSPPNVSFVSPTPSNNTNTSNTSIFINVTTNEILSFILLDWNGTNETMNGSGLNFYLNKTITGSGNFTYKVYGNDSADNIGVSETRIITINNTAPNATSVTINSTDALNRTNGTLIGSWSFYDANSDNQLDNETKWYNNSIEATALANLTSIGSGNTTKDQNWTFSVRVFDGIEWSEWINSTILTIENSAPTQSSLNSPTDGATNQLLTVTLNVTITDIDGDNMNLSFYDASNDLLLGTNNSLSSESYATYEWSDLSYSTTYEWYVNITDGIDTYQSQNWSLITKAEPTSTSGGGGGGSSVTYEQKSLGTLAAGSSKKVTFSKSSTLGVSEIEIIVKNKVSNAKIKVDTGSLSSGASKPSTKGSIYKYIEITKTGMADDDIEKAVIKFKVKKSWLTEKGYGKDTIALHRYYNNKWTKLTTTRDSQDTTYYYYSAESPGFSTFAITAEKAPAVIIPVEEPEEEEQEEAEITEKEIPVEEEAPAQVEAPEEEKEAPSKTTLIVTLIAVVIVLTIVGYFVQKKKPKKKKKKSKRKKQ